MFEVRMIKGLALCFVICLPACPACTEGNFAGNTKKQSESPDPEERPTDGFEPNPSKNVTRPEPGEEELEENWESFDIPDDCTSAGVTQARLLTETVENGQPGNFIEYEISLTDCDGQRHQVEARSILFDINATTTTEDLHTPLRYVITRQGANGQVISGELLVIRGSDLFGRAGANLFHNRTDKPVNFTSSSDTLILRIELRGRSLKPIGAANFSSLRIVLPTYLRFGDASPVRRDVTFVGAGEFGP